jgi:hypothetical protein
MSGLRIVGGLPDPDGRDRDSEVIRLKNDTEESISLSGWKVRDDDGDQLGLSGMIAAGRIREVVDTENDLPLSNRGGFVELINLAGQVVQRVQYERVEVSRGEFIVFE